MADERERALARLMGAHLLALAKATSVYQAELAKFFLGMESEEEREDAGPAYALVRELEESGIASGFLDRSPEGPERALRSLAGSQAVLFNHWLKFVEEPWRWAGVSPPDEPPEE